MRGGVQAIWARAVDEQERIVAKHGTALTMAVLNEMTELHLIIMEALRLFPPLIGLMRYVKEDFTVTTSKGKSYRIPKVATGLSDISASRPFQNCRVATADSAVKWRLCSRQRVSV
jgi:Cytochrome P450